MTLKFEKQRVLDLIDTNDNPQNWRLKNLVGPSIQIKRLLNDMKREGLITINFVNDGGKIRRVLTKKINNINELSTDRKMVS